MSETGYRRQRIVYDVLKAFGLGKSTVEVPSDRLDVDHKYISRMMARVGEKSNTTISRNRDRGSLIFHRRADE